jgi:hypothetical protein
MPSINIATPISIPANGLPPHIVEMTEDTGEGDSQYSYKDSMSSLIDFDPDETIASQQTTATELTQPSPSRVSRVRKAKSNRCNVRADGR